MAAFAFRIRITSRIHRRRRMRRLSGDDSFVGAIGLTQRTVREARNVDRRAAVTVDSRSRRSKAIIVACSGPRQASRPAGFAGAEASV